MTGRLILGLAVAFAACGAHEPVPRAGKSPSGERGARHALAGITPAPQGGPGVVSTDPANKQAVPAEFAGVDFRNLSYPVDWKVRQVKLEGGSYRYDDPVDYSGSFEIVEVSYADVDGDGKKEAIVDLLWEKCGGSCDAGSHLFYLFAIRRGELALLRRFSTGSLAHGCGLKSFSPGEGRLTIEVFRDCRFSAGRFVSEQQPGKFEAHEFTRFTFEAVRGRLAPTKREVLPHPSGDVWRW